MRTIVETAMKEKIRKKELYIIAAIGLIVMMLVTTGTGTITLNGVPLTAYQNIIPVLMNVTNVICGVLAIVLSLRTIPNEYERKTSHLIWMRGVSQTRYHAALAIANLWISVMAVAIMYVGVLFYTLQNSDYAGAIRTIPAFLISSLSIMIVSLLTSALSICLPSFVAGSIVTIVYLVGILYELLDVYRGMVEGAASTMLKVLLFIVPNLNGIQVQAGSIIMGDSVEWHLIAKGLLTLYVITWLFIVSKKKEA